MEATINGSVGVGGINSPADVLVVQRLLLSHGFRIGRADGICGHKTIQGLISFQGGFLHFPDGRVDPGGRTWRHLNNISSVERALYSTKPLTRLVPRPASASINAGLHAVSVAVMEKKLGKPRATYTQDCQDVTDAKLKRNIISSKVGCIYVRGLAPAVASLQAVFQEIALKQPEVYSVIGTEGMLCCRYRRSSSTAISNHSWGTAIDLTISGVLDKRGDGKVQYGLTLIAPIFNRFGWYWGAGFPTEDGMHFEGSRTLVEKWAPQLT